MSVQEFGTLVRTWRRKRRLSQLELALAGNVSQRHVSFLESGRARPSRQMALHLAEQLDLPLREQNRLLLAAGFAPAHRESGLDAPDLSEARQVLALLLRQHEPFPAAVVDPCWNVLIANDAAQRLLAALGVRPAGPLNLVRLTLAADGLRPWIANWPEFARSALHHLERQARENTGCAGMLAELRRDPEIAELSHGLDWEQAPKPVLALSLAKDGVSLKLLSIIASFGTPQDVTLQELRIESFFPADPASESFLRKLAVSEKVS